MSTEDISNAKDPDLRSSLAALRRASRLARRAAIQAGTDLVVVREGRMVRISADALRRQAEAENSHSS